MKTSSDTVRSKNYFGARGRGDGIPPRTASCGIAQLEFASKHAVIVTSLEMPAKKKGKGKQKKGGLGDLESIVSSVENVQVAEEAQQDVEGELVDQTEETPKAALDFEGLAQATEEQEETGTSEPLALEEADPEKELSRKEKKKLKKKVRRSPHASYNRTHTHTHTHKHTHTHTCTHTCTYTHTHSIGIST